MHALNASWSARDISKFELGVCGGAVRRSGQSLIGEHACAPVLPWAA